MKAVVVPGVTDLNKGDQALVWESHRLIMDIKCFTKVFIVSTGDTREERQKLCGQSEERGYELIENILKHPRRGSYNAEEAVKESFFSYVKLITVAIKDFISRSILLLVCKNQKVVNILYNKQTADSIKKFNEVEVFFVKGGGFIHAYGEKTAPYLMWFFLFYVRLAIAMKKKVVFLPNSYGPFEGLSVKRQVVSVFNRLDKIYAREELSSMKMGELLNKKIEVSPDLGFYLKMGDKEKSIKLLEKYNLSIKDKIIGITIRPWRFPGKSNPEFLYEKYISSVVILSEYILNKGYKVVLCNQSIGPNSHEDDRNSIKEILKRISNPNIIWINENLPCDELKALYSNFYIFVGTRFHSVIFSLTSLVPSLAIGYGGNKAKGIMSDFDLKNFTIQIEDTTGEQLVEMFNELVLNYDSVKEKLLLNIDLLNNKRQEIINEIVKIVKN